MILGSWLGKVSLWKVVVCETRRVDLGVHLVIKVRPLRYSLALKLAAGVGVLYRTEQLIKRLRV